MKKNWIQIRRDLYLRIRESIDQKMGGVPREIKAYQKVFAKEFHSDWKVITKSAFFNRVKKSELVFLADFHALKQSQKSHLRILRPFSGQQIVLMMECFLSKDQKWIDAFLEKKISEKKFLDEIQWGKSWSFPWENYRPLIKWAVQNEIKVFGLNAAGVKDLRKRDFHAAQLISKVIRKYPHKKIFVQYGDLHISTSKLPSMTQKAMLRPIDYIKVHQNAEELYFELLKKGLEPKFDLIELNQRTYCLMNVPPWVKWQNYLFYLEGDSHELMKTRSQYHESVDFTDHIAGLVDFLSAELGLKISAANLSVFTAEDSGVWKKITSRIKKAEFAKYQTLIEESVSFYVPQAGLGYLANPSVNHAAQLAIQYIHSELQSEKSRDFQFPQNFYQVILIESLSYFGTKLVNHRRKTETLFDMKSALAQVESRESTKEALLLALSQKTRELLVLAGRKNARLSYKPKRKSSFSLAARLLGGLLGEKIYLAYRRGYLTQAEIRRLYSVPLFAESFQKAYFDLLKKVDRLSLDFKSKMERL